MRTYLPKIGMLLLATFLTSCFFKTKDNKENKEPQEIKEVKETKYENKKLTAKNNNKDKNRDTMDSIQVRTRN